jgi:hypothetical protein
VDLRPATAGQSTTLWTERGDGLENRVITNDHDATSGHSPTWRRYLRQTPIASAHSGLLESATEPRRQHVSEPAVGLVEADTVLLERTVGIELGEGAGSTSTVMADTARSRSISSAASSIVLVVSH